MAAQLYSNKLDGLCHRQCWEIPEYCKTNYLVCWFWSFHEIYWQQAEYGIMRTSFLWQQKIY